MLHPPEREAALDRLMGVRKSAGDPSSISSDQQLQRLVWRDRRSGVRPWHKCGSGKRITRSSRDPDTGGLEEPTARHQHAHTPSLSVDGNPLSDIVPPWPTLSGSGQA